MKLINRTRAGLAAALAAGIGIGFGAVGTAAAAPTTATTTGTVTHHYSLAASAFAPDGLHNTAEDYFNGWDPTTLSNTDSGRCFNAGLSLPPNAILNSVTAYYTEGTTAMYFEINQQDLANHTATDLASFDSTAATTPTYTSTTKSLKNVKVNMTNDAYSVGVCPNGDTTFSGLTITYQVSG
jgi:hypothetical protein